MEHLIIHLKQSLIQRKQNEQVFLGHLNQETDNNLILVSTGKIFELDFVIHQLDDLLAYMNKNSRIC